MGNLRPVFTSQNRHDRLFSDSTLETNCSQRKSFFPKCGDAVWINSASGFTSRHFGSSLNRVSISEHLRAMKHVLGRRHPFKIADEIVGWIAVFMVYLRSFRRRFSEEGAGYQTVHHARLLEVYTSTQNNHLASIRVETGSQDTWCVGRAKGTSLSANTPFVRNLVKVFPIWSISPLLHGHDLSTEAMA